MAVSADEKPLNTRKIRKMLMVLPSIHIMNIDITICILLAEAMPISFYVGGGGTFSSIALCSLFD